MRYLKNHPAVVSGTNQRDMYVYPCIVTIVENACPALATGETEPIFTFLQAIRRRYNYQRMVTSFTDDRTNEVACLVRPGPRPPDDYRDKDIYTLTILARFLEDRG